MTKLDKIVHVCVSTLAALLVGAGVAHAQPVPAPTPTPPAGPAPTGLVVGSGNFYSPIVANLEAGRRVLPGRYRLRRAGRAHERGHQSAAHEDVRLAGRTSSPADRARTADSGRRRDRRAFASRRSAGRAWNSGAWRRDADGQRARYRCDARPTEAARRAGCHERWRSRVDQRRPAARSRGSRTRLGTSSSSCRPPVRRRRQRGRTRTSSASEYGTRSRTSSARCRFIVTRSGCKAAAKFRSIKPSPACSPCLGFRPARNTASRRSRCRRRAS